MFLDQTSKRHTTCKTLRLIAQSVEKKQSIASLFAFFIMNLSKKNLSEQQVSQMFWLPYIYNSKKNKLTFK